MNTTFDKLPIKSVFRALRNDIIGSGEAARAVNNDGLYVKVGNNVSVDLTKGNKDCIFLLDMPVREVKASWAGKLDVTLLPSYKACNKNA